ncbi:hypothetical protein [uncultured Mediterranean phage uvMED]|nr:hypothetical protein [uncultured Mediterranean phage uvMED]BAQ92641.1 hypothetical protein [uncultured Mediterranean phage uvMED]
MAKNITYNYRKKSKKKRPGIHSKNASRTKGSKGYKKKYKGQGKN